MTPEKSSTSFNKDVYDPPVPLGGRVRMCIIGVGYLFPISAVWAAFDYWKVLFPDRNVEFAVTCSYQFFAVLTVAVLSVAPQVHFVRGIVGGFSGQFFALLIITLFPVLGLTPDAQYVLLLCTVSFCAIVTGFLDSALLSLCSQYSARMQAALQVGIGFSTSLSVAYRDITKYSIPREIVSSAVAYFIAALVTVWICLASFFSLKRMPISHTIFDNKPSAQNVPLLDLKLEEERPRIELLRRVWRNQASIFGNFVLTTAAYPGLITAITPRSAAFHMRNHWYQTILLTCFAVCDTGSRFFLGYRCGLSWRNIHYVVLLRMILLPMVIVCVLGYVPDVLNFVVVALYGLSNGYVCSLSLVVQNELPDLKVKERRTVGRWSAFSVNAGLCLGSFLGACIGISLDVA